MIGSKHVFEFVFEFRQLVYLYLKSQNGMYLIFGQDLKSICNKTLHIKQYQQQAKHFLT